VRLVDARPGHPASHLLGAVHADVDTELAAVDDPAHGGRHPLPPVDDFAARLGAWGIGPATPVVIYDDHSGANAAARLWWMLRALGHEAVAVLDGGLRAAVAAGLPMTGEPSPVTALPPYPHRGAWRLPLADIDEVDAARADPSRRIVDVRAAFRFRGESEPFDPVAGHIPGAVNAPYGASLGPDGRLRRPEELRAHYLERLAGVPPAGAIVHCGSGVTACLTLLGLEVAGLPGAALYVGSWSEWCRSGRPRASGEE
jgi:thiosulfate/3-mercaptopyruvate sulfurtransferase